MESEESDTKAPPVAGQYPPHPKGQRWVLDLPTQGSKLPQGRKACQAFGISREDAVGKLKTKLEHHVNSKGLGLSPQGMQFGHMEVVPK
jgi:hypothetical protein